MKKIENKLKRTRQVPMNKTAANQKASRYPESSSPIRNSDYLVIAGFYDDDFNTSHGIPMSKEESFKLAWKLWRLASEGTTLIVQCSPDRSNMTKWWPLGVFDSLFNNSNSLKV